MLEEALNEDLLEVAKWLNRNKLTLNLSKTKSMIIGSSRKTIGIPSLSLHIFESYIDSVSSFKYLGIMKVKCDHRSKFSNLSNWKEEA